MALVKNQECWFCHKKFKKNELVCSHPVFDDLHIEGETLIRFCNPECLMKFFETKGIKII